MGHRLRLDAMRVKGEAQVGVNGAENYDVRGSGDEFVSWLGLNLLYR